MYHNETEFCKPLVVWKANQIFSLPPSQTVCLFIFLPLSSPLSLCVATCFTSHKTPSNPFVFPAFVDWFNSILFGVAFHEDKYLSGQRHEWPSDKANQQKIYMEIGSAFVTVGNQTARYKNGIRNFTMEIFKYTNQCFSVFLCFPLLYLIFFFLYFFF